MFKAERRDRGAVAAAAGLALVLGAGCGGGDDAASPPDAGGDVIAVSTIETFHGARGDEDRAMTFADEAEAPRLYVLRDGEVAPSLIEHAADRQDGHYQLHAGVGRRYVAVGTDFVVDPPATIDFGVSVVGRADAILAGTGTTLELTADGLSPWSQTDFLQVLVPNTSGFGYNLNPPGAFQTGTMIIAAPVNWHGSGLASAARGDELWALQLRHETVDDLVIEHYPRVLHRADVEQTDAVATAVAGSFVTPPMETLQLDVRFAAFATALGSDGFTTTIFSVVTPKARRFGQGDIGDDFDSIASRYRAATDDGDGMVTFSYENPFPAEWPESVQVGVEGSRPYLLAGSEADDLVRAQVQVVQPRAAAEAATISPLVGPVRRPKLGGRDASEDLTGVGEVPVLSWDAPDLGTPAGYRVELNELTLQQSLTTHVVVARFYTTSTSFQLVPGLLEAGKTYFVRVTALAGDDVDVLRAPLRVPLTYAAADLLSGTFTR